MRCRLITAIGSIISIILQVARNLSNFCICNVYTAISTVCLCVLHGISRDRTPN
jgi:hypothetical protein